MTDLERRALLGDAEAQRECTEKGIVLTCPICGASLALDTKIDFLFHVPNGRVLSFVAINNMRSSIQRWNTRPAPPIGRCASCACWDENTCECTAAADIEVAYHRYTEPDFFCGDYEPKGGEENG